MAGIWGQQPRLTFPRCDVIRYRCQAGSPDTAHGGADIGHLRTCLVRWLRTGGETSNKWLGMFDKFDTGGLEIYEAELDITI